MRLIDKYKDIQVESEEAAFKYLLDNLKETIKTYDFFVAWNKIFPKVAKIDVSLNILNSLIGKNDAQAHLKILIKKYPEVVPVLPLLIAVREKEIKISDSNRDISYNFMSKVEYTGGEIEQIVDFVEQCGLLKAISDKKIKNLVDYYTGVEVGLDTNARKNRSGTAMENLSNGHIHRLCEQYRYEYIIQATAAKIKKELGYEVPVDKARRKFDFAINTGKHLYIVEVNYYSGGGSKLKAVAGEFKILSTMFSSSENITFIWITDGKGWNTAKKPLREAFATIDFVINLKMLEEGFLEAIFKNQL